jgi:hypothetical protein
MDYNPVTVASYARPHEAHLTLLLIFSSGGC